MFYILLILNILPIFFMCIFMASIRLSIKKLLLLLSPTCIIVATARTYNQLLSIVLIVLIMILILYIERIRLVTSIIIPLFAMLFGVLVQNVVILILHATGGPWFSADETQLTDGGLLILTISQFIIILIAGRIIGKKLSLKYRNHIERISKHIAGPMIAGLVISFIAIYLIALSTDGDMKTMVITTIAYVLYVVLIGIISIISIRGNRKESELTRRNLELNQLRDYTNKLEVVYNDVRRMRHDYANVLTSMTGYMEADDMPGLVQYFDEKIVPFNNVMREDNLKLNKLTNLKQVEVKSVVSAKVFKMLELNIEVYVDIVDTFYVNSVDIIDLCRIIGILLDNAMEASLEVEDPKVEIGFINKADSKMIFISNTCNESTDPLFKLYEEGFSTKGEGRGIGLSNLKNLIGKYQRVSNDTEINEGVFRQIIDIRESS